MPDNFTPDQLYEGLLSSIEDTYRITKDPMDIEIKLKEAFPKQRSAIDDPAKRKIFKVGRRGGKTVGVSILAIEGLKKKRRVLYGAPTSEQLDQFWAEITQALAEPIADGRLYKNETRHLIEMRGTPYRIRAKTCWNSDMLRGDWGDLLILDEWQLMSEDTWDRVGAPMLIDNNGDAVFLYTPPSLHSRSLSKAKDPMHASRMFKKAKEDKTGLWAAFEWTSHENPHLSEEGLNNVTKDMSSLAYRMEILVQEETEAPGALWKRKDIDDHRVNEVPQLTRIVVGVDPSASSTGNEAGIITAGKNGQDAYVLSDNSLQGSPLTWATAAVKAYDDFKADCIVAEANQGGEMVATTIHQIRKNVKVKLVHASRGKQTRAEPVSAQGEKGRVHHVGTFNQLEDELCLWVPGDDSPNRLDAYVWALTELMLGGVPGFIFIGGRG
jgi:hypothetical protein